MKVVAVNASPRKGWNSDQMLDAFIEGVQQRCPTAEVEKVQLYDMDFKGCRGCLACALKATENGQCLYKDGATQLLRAIKSADGFVFSAPVYYFEVPSQMRAILERLFYPGAAAKEIPVTCIYTMNQPRENMEKYFGRHIEDLSMHLGNTFHTDPEVIYAFQTLQWKNPERYLMPEAFYEERKRIHDAQFANDLQNAREGGMRMADRIGNADGNVAP